MIANFEQLATTPLRKQALLISSAGLAATAIHPFMEARVWYDSRRDQIGIGGRKISLQPFQHVILVGIGSGSLAASGYLQKALGPRLTAGFVIDEVAEQMPRILSRKATPTASIANTAITKELMSLLSDCAADDVIITVMTGGRDLLSAPAGMVLEDKRAIINALIESGASPAEISMVRNHLSLARGGNLAKLAFPAAMLNLVFDNQGLTSRDFSTVHDAREVLNRHRILEKCGLSSCDLYETPKQDSYFQRVLNLDMSVGEMARQAMARKAEDLGYNVIQDQDWSELGAGQCWIGSPTQAAQAVGTMPDSGVLVTLGGGQANLLDAESLVSAKRTGLEQLDARNWGEAIDRRSVLDHISTPLAVYLKPA
jgi:glycerate 2-kinase